MSNQKLESMSLSSIDVVQLGVVCGGNGQPPAHYNGQDVQNGIKGGLAGSRFGPIGSVIGFGAGFMSRNVGELFNAGRDLYREYQRGRQLDAQRRR